jgi:hypothetical protein
MENLFEYALKGALVLAGLLLAFVVLSFAEMVILPFAIGYLIALLLQKAYEKIFPPPYEPVYHDPPRPLTIWEERYTWKLEEPKKLEIPLIQPQSEETKIQEAPEEIEEEQDKTEEEPEEEFIFNRNFYVERKLSHKEKEALFAQGYTRLKTSPYGDSGAAYYWVKTRYNESKEHAFFCYLIEKELRKYTKQVELFVNNGPDVIVRHGGNVYAFDVETGKNLIRKPEETRIKFERYKGEYFRSYVFVTNKTLKRTYQSMGIVITRATFKKTISDIFY